MSTAKKPDHILTMEDKGLSTSQSILTALRSRIFIGYDMDLNQYNHLLARYIGYLSSEGKLDTDPNTKKGNVNKAIRQDTITAKTFFDIFLPLLRVNTGKITLEIDSEELGPIKVSQTFTVIPKEESGPKETPEQIKFLQESLKSLASK